MDWSTILAGEKPDVHLEQFDLRQPLVTWIPVPGQQREFPMADMGGVVLAVSHFRFSYRLMDLLSGHRLLSPQRLFLNETLNVVQLHGYLADRDRQGFMHPLRIDIIVFMHDPVAEPGGHRHLLGKIGRHDAECSEEGERFMMVFWRRMT